MFKRSSQSRKSTAALTLTYCVCLLSFTGCIHTAPDTREADEKTLRELDAQWSNAAGAKDINAIVAYYADDAVVMPGDAPLANTKQAIRELWIPMMAPGISVSWRVNGAEVARSGDLGYVTGVYQLVTKDAAGKATTEHGKLLEVWKKQSNGKWKCVIDNFSADAPPVSPVPENNK